MMVSRPTRIYFENLVGSLLEHPDGYAIVQYNAGKRILTDLQAFLTHASQLLRTRSWNKILADQSAMAPFTEEESTWIKQYWLARSEQPIFGAIVLPEDVFARLSVNNLVSEAESAALTYRVFDNTIDAAAWLHTQS
ncbi:hypothetical protein [Hymenobacter sp. DG25A]|uniref:hypothetical protein n=1 Tax=Hymenobacter sp. DG25A TaxID=1385663 RepID=UPI0006BD8B34|nr:hypothetical protein [Hymenobacter sp. DG25A]ALD21330.1 hypothetical protein AM218_09015 [Hymenobacter sp. DG25A]